MFNIKKKEKTKVVSKKYGCFTTNSLSVSQNKETIFIILLVIVIFIVSVLIYQSIQNVIIEQHELISSTAIMSIDEKIDNSGLLTYQLLSVDEISDIISLESSDDPEYYGKIYSASKEIAKYSNSFNFGEIFFYFTKSNTVISSKATCTDAEKFYGDIFTFGDCSYEEFLDMLNGIEYNESFVFGDVITLGHDINTGIIVAEKVTNYYNNESAYIFIVLDEKYIDSLFQNLTDNSAQISIKNPEGNIIYSNDNYIDTPKNNTDYLSTSFYTEHNLTYEINTPKNVIFEELMIYYIVSLTVCIIVVFFVIIILAAKNIQNDRAIRDIANISGVNPVKNYPQLLKTLSDTVLELVDTNKSLNKSTGISTKALQKEFFLHLLVTGFSDIGDVKLYSENANISLSSKHHIIVISSAFLSFEISPDDVVVTLKGINSTLSKKIESMLNGHGHSIRIGCEEVVVIISEDSNFDNLALSIYSLIEEEMRSHSNIKFEITSTNQAVKIDVLKAYYLNCAKFNYRKSIIDNSFNNEISLEHNSIQQSNRSNFSSLIEEQRNLLITFVRHSKREKVEKLFFTMFLKVVELLDTNENTKGIFITTIKHILVSSSVNQSYDFNEIFTAINSMSISYQQYTFVLSELVKICYENEKFTDESSKQVALIQSIQNYIEENIAQYEMSLNSISKEFNFAPAYFSALFKEVMGDNFSRYLEKRRMKLAKELLCSGKIKVEDVGIRCGYSNVSSFRRVFKKHFGISPSQIKPSNFTI